MQPLQSSNLAGCEYDAEKQKLRIKFRSGSTYEYSGVPVEDYDGLVGASSAGKFFADNIKDSYPTQRLG